MSQCALTLKPIAYIDNIYGTPYQFAAHGCNSCWYGKVVCVGLVWWKGVVGSFLKTYDLSLCGKGRMFTL